MCDVDTFVAKLKNPQIALLGNTNQIDDKVIMTVVNKFSQI